MDTLSAPVDFGGEANCAAGCKKFCYSVSNPLIVEAIQMSNYEKGTGVVTGAPNDIGAVNASRLAARNSNPISDVEQHGRPVAMKLIASAARDKLLFEDSLLESSLAQRQRRTWATLLSIVFQLLLIGLLVLLPLWFTDVLPKQQLLTFLEAPPPPPPPPPPAASSPPAAKVAKVTNNIMNGQLRTPSRIPAKVQIIKEDEAPPPVTTTAGVVGGVPGGIPGGQLGGVIAGIISSSSSVAAVPILAKPLPTPQRVHVSQGVTKGLLIHRVEPTYPPLAEQAHIQGAVVLTAIIDKAGNVQQLQVVSGHPLLAPAAVAAVIQWRYKPFLLNGRPVEVETTVTVSFHIRSE
jgi:periplasmic protein TonB